MINLNNIKNQKFSKTKTVELLFYTFPVSFIIGNFALSLHLLLFIVISLFLIKNEKLDTWIWEQAGKVNPGGLPDFYPHKTYEHIVKYNKEKKLLKMPMVSLEKIIKVVILLKLKML